MTTERKVNNETKPLSTLAQGAHFIHGSTEWVKLDDNNGVLCLAAEPVAFKAFDKCTGNDWSNSSLREWLNTTYIRSLIAEGADRESFVHIGVNLTADDGLKEYDAVIDNIALLSCEQYRKYHEYIPKIEKECWTLTPTTCKSDAHYIKLISEDGQLVTREAICGAYVRPLYCLKGDTLVSLPAIAPIGADPIGKQIYEQLKNEYPDYTDDQIMDMLIVAMYYAAHE